MALATLGSVERINPVENGTKANIRMNTELDTESPLPWQSRTGATRHDFHHFAFKAVIVFHVFFLEKGRRASPAFSSSV